MVRALRSHPVRCPPIGADDSPWAALAMRADQEFRPCLADYDVMAGPYEALAGDYDWMFDGDELADGRAINQPATARLLQRISRTSAVLDAACGTGVDAAALDRKSVV